jgi:DNA-binding CsgD family transcriptional regulator
MNKQVLSEKENALLTLEKQHMEEELTNAKKILDNYTESMLRKNEMLEQFTIELNKLKSLKSKELYEEKIEQMDLLNKSTILTEDDWNKFKELFEQVYDSFFTRLREKLPDLSQAEIRLACLIKLKLSTKEIAGILGVSPNTIKTTRYRLRKKLNMLEETSLEDIILSI